MWVGKLPQWVQGFLLWQLGTTAWRLCEPIGERKTVDYNKRWGVGNSEA